MLSRSLKQRKLLLWRGLWLLAMLLHAPISIKVGVALIGGAENANWSSAFLLGLTNLFFLAEIYFAFSLRLITDRRSAIAFLLVVALLHVGVIDRGFPDLVIDSSWNLALVGTIGAVLVWRQLQRSVIALLTRIASLTTLRCEESLHTYLSRIAPRLWLSPQVPAQQFATHRGPPRR